MSRPLKVSFIYHQSQPAYNLPFKVSDKHNNTPDTTTRYPEHNKTFTSTVNTSLNHSRNKEKSTNYSILSSGEKYSPPPEPVPETSESLEYSHIKPMFGFNKFRIFCGFEKETSENGCECGEVCRWRQKWTSNYRESNHKLYIELQKEKSAQVHLKQIRKDLRRTHTECQTFSKNQHFQTMLKQVLITYSVYDPQIGYVQGINLIAGALLYHIKDAELTFWSLIQLMDDQELRSVFLEGFLALKQHCKVINSLIKNKIFDLYTHMEQLQILPDLFLYGWIFSLMSNIIPIQHLHLVMDQFRTYGWNFIYKLIIGYLLYLKEYLMMTEESSEFLEYLSSKNVKELDIEWEELIENCYKIKLG